MNEHYRACTPTCTTEHQPRDRAVSCGRCGRRTFALDARCGCTTGTTR